MSDLHKMNAEAWLEETSRLRTELAEVRATLAKLEWSAGVASGPERWAKHARACPLCRGIKPDPAFSRSFTESAFGHRPDCVFTAQQAGGGR